MRFGVGIGVWVDFNIIVLYFFVCFYNVSLSLCLFYVTCLCLIYDVPYSSYFVALLIIMIMIMIMI